MDYKTMVASASKFSKNGMPLKALECFRVAYSIDYKATYPFLAKWRNYLTAKLRKNGTPDDMEALKQAYILSAKEYFDDFCIATEWDRQNKFYLPRRKALLPLANALQKLADDELDILCISMPPGTGKSGLAIFFLTWMAGNNPLEGMLGGSHNSSFLRGVYEECIREMDKDGEYLWSEIFKGHSIKHTNAQDMRIDIDKEQRFSTFQFSSIGSGNAGKVRAVQLLYCDDLIEGIEEAMSKERLDKKWQLYTTDLRQRKQGANCKELHIATRWSVHDIIGRLEQEYGGSDRAMFITVPALNEDGESNFDYGGSAGFTTEFYNDMKLTMDDVSWRALYMNQPIEREGLLYDSELLRRFYRLPEGEPDAVVAVCDTAEGGGDDTVMPIFAIYGNDHYMIDCVCSDQLPEITDALCAEALVRNKVQTCQFESNAAGGRTADKVEELVRSKCDAIGQKRTHITKHRTTQNKATKIIVNSPFVKERCLFKDDLTIDRGSAYSVFMRKMCSYSVAGKNKHDDVVDALAQYAIYTENLFANVVTVVKRPF